MIDDCFPIQVLYWSRSIITLDIADCGFLNSFWKPPWIAQLLYDSYSASITLPFLFVQSEPLKFLFSAISPCSSSGTTKSFFLQPL